MLAVVDGMHEFLSEKFGNNNQADEKSGIGFNEPAYTMLLLEPFITDVLNGSRMTGNREDFIYDSDDHKFVVEFKNFNHDLQPYAGHFQIQQYIPITENNQYTSVLSLNVKNDNMIETSGSFQLCDNREKKMRFLMYNMVSHNTSIIYQVDHQLFK